MKEPDAAALRAGSELAAVAPVGAGSTDFAPAPVTKAATAGPGSARPSAARVMGYWLVRIWHGRAPRGKGNAAGRVLLTAGVLPALVVAAYLLVSFLLLLLGAFHPWTALPLTVIAAAVMVRLVWRRCADMTAPWWSVAATIAVAVAFGAVTVATHAEHLIIERDAGSYAQFGAWLAHHASLPIRGQFDAFGGPDQRLSLESSAFFQQGDTVVPQFMVGWPLLLAAASWFGGLTLLLSSTGIVGAFAVLALAGFGARLLGPRWAPLVALVAATTFPILHISQATYSEPLALLLFFGGFCLLVDAARGSGSRTLALAAGLMVGAVGLARLDAGREISLLVLVAGWMLVRRRREAWPLLAGLAVGTAFGVTDGAVFTRPYVMQNLGSVELMGVMAAGCLLLVAVGVPLLRRVRDWSWLGRLGPPLGVVVALIWVFFTIRPLIQVQHQYTPQSVVDNVARIQQQEGLPVDGTRTYGEYSLHWVSWYLGWPAIVLAALGTVLVVHRLCRGRELRWVAPLVVLFGSSLLVLYRPGITPDHPWADRRLVPVVLPAVILFAVYGIREISRWFRSALDTAASARQPVPSRPADAARPSGLVRYAAPRTGRGLFARARGLGLEVPLAVILSLAVVIPAVVASRPLAFTRTEYGELNAVETVCAALKPTDAVLILNGADKWSQTIRADCGVPTAALVAVTNPNIAYFVGRIEATGHTPVLVTGDDPTPIAAYGLQPRHLVHVYFQWDLQSLTTPPTTTNLGLHDLWLARPGTSGPG